MAYLDKISGTLGHTRAAHLLRRATFGPTIPEIEEFALLGIDDALDRLLDLTEEDPLPPIDILSGQSWVDPENPVASKSEQDILFGFFKSWHMDVMRQAPTTLRERITWFFHTHIPARWTEIRSSEAIYYQNRLFRFYAYGSFKELFKKICVDNAMLVYLDGHTNRKSAPNENFAREMFELYSIGKGPQVAEGDYTNYTEEDIRQATRVLTGWQFDADFNFLDEETGIPRGSLRGSSDNEQSNLATEHDDGQKTFTEKFQNRSIEPTEIVDGYPSTASTYAELDEMIEMIFEQEATSLFIARKLYRFFMYHFISEEVENNVIEGLARVLRDNDYSIIEALKVLLASEHFYDADDLVTENDNVGALIKSPVDLFTGLFRMFNIAFPDRETETESFYAEMSLVVRKLVDQGLNFYEPFEVAGYPAYHQVPGFNRNWITTYALAYRYQAGDFILGTMGNEEQNFKLDIVDWVRNSGAISDPSDSVELLDVLITNLFAVQLNEERRNYFHYTIFLDTTLEDEYEYARGIWTRAWNDYLSSEDDTEVRTRLELLFSALIQTPEFQLY